ncbi:alpha/beta hydrolase [Sphaerisporangium sp. TRM90804]|uniref:alpha/beta fold hydrolase n=1 Tax=Sphaerisporangium sp. TRM90804 TaxID=3031113 RepID=UPI002448B0A9|nr:alpha/beta hydrolase [Sphaerisporangium sp. TRM90804]MDH2426876.1 alpha/beta hydrolase [Sphaerisporangium sp. TRM90804]
MPLNEITTRPKRTTPVARRLRRAVISTFAALAVALCTTTASAGAAQTPGEPAQGPASFAPGFTHGKVAVEGGNLHYVRGGSGPAIVLLHGWPETWLMWRPVMPALARDHTVIAFDLPGLGDSAIPSGGYDKATTAKRIREAVHKLGFTQVELLGHDLGVLIAHPYARDFPGEVTRFAVIESPLAGFGLEQLYGLSWHFRFNMSPAPIPEKIMDNADVSTYLGMMYGFSFNREGIDAEAYYRAYASPARRTAGYNYYRAFPADAENNLANASKRLPMPVLAIGGQYSFGTGVADSFRQVADDVRPVVAPDAGHFVPEENPGFVADCANLFFAAQDTAPPRPELAPCVR